MKAPIALQLWRVPAVPRSNEKAALRPILDNSGRASTSPKDRRRVGSNARPDERSIHSPGEGLSEWAGCGRCGNPMRAASADRASARVGRGQAEADRDSVVPVLVAVPASNIKRVRGDRGKPRSRPPPQDPGRAKPKGGAGGARPKSLSGHKALLEGSKPRNRGLLGRSDATAAEIPLG
jgi:hypothetical protein